MSSSRGVSAPLAHTTTGTRVLKLLAALPIEVRDAGGAPRLIGFDA
jgi:hypothetical protein